MNAVAVIVIFCAIVYWLIISPRIKAQHSKKFRGRGAVSNNYRAASIGCRKNACAAARALADKRFLADEVPRIPLPDCDTQKCDCRYFRYEDRRLSEERRSQFNTQLDPYVLGGNVERRARAGRRREDLLEKEFGLQVIR